MNIPAEKKQIQDEKQKIIGIGLFPASLTDATNEVATTTTNVKNNTVNTTSTSVPTTNMTQPSSSNTTDVISQSPIKRGSALSRFQILRPYLKNIFTTCCIGDICVGAWWLYNRFYRQSSAGILRA